MHGRPLSLMLSGSGSFIRLTAILVCGVLWGDRLVGAEPEPSSLLTEARGMSLENAPMPGKRDFGYLYWKNSLRHLDDKGRLPVVVKTGWYGLEMDVLTAKVLRFGASEAGGLYGESAAMELPNNLPAGRLDLTVKANGKTYHCVKAAQPPRWPPNSPVHPFGSWNNSDAKKWPFRIREYGRYRQQVDFDQLDFRTQKGERLPARVMLQVNAWPDVLGMSLRMVPEKALSDVTMNILLSSGEDERNASATAETLEADKELRADLRWDFDEVPEVEVRVVAKDSSVPVEVLKVPHQGNTEIRFSLKPWDSADRKLFDRLDEFQLELKNPGNQPAVARIVFNGTSPTGPFIMAALPVLADTEGRPVGAVFQNNHLWAELDNTRKRTPDMAPWIDIDPLDHQHYAHNALVVRLAPGQEWKGTVRYNYAHWGGVPKASYYNLFLAEWGWYTHWDCGYIGAWGESICPSPDSMISSDIADWRGLFVPSRDTKRNPPWEWTPNVGGANWLYLVPPSGKYPPHRLVKGDFGRVALANRWTMIAPGPNLARTLYSGKTADGRIAYRIELMLPRTDDVNRVFYRIRYDVLEPVDFRHLAFFQMACAEYDYNSPKDAAWGSREGLQEEMRDMPTTQSTPIREAVELKGPAPWWISLHRSLQIDSLRENNPVKEKGNSSRGLIVRQWEARLGGKKVPVPSLSIQPVHFLGGAKPGDGSKLLATSAMVELAPPAGVTRVQAGDFVEMDVVMVLVPKYADSYMGPNLALKKALPAIADTWKAIYREAVGNAPQVSIARGTLVSMQPLDIRVDVEGRADVEITGGLGYLPLIFSGVTSPTTISLSEEGDQGEWIPVDQSVHGNDFWQVEREEGLSTFRVTYNLPMDSKDGAPLKRTLRFQSGRKGGDSAQPQATPKKNL